MQLVSEHTCSN